MGCGGSKNDDDDYDGPQRRTYETQQATRAPPRPLSQEVHQEPVKVTGGGGGGGGKGNKGKNADQLYCPVCSEIIPVTKVLGLARDKAKAEGKGEGGKWADEQAYEDWIQRGRLNCKKCGRCVACLGDPTNENVIRERNPKANSDMSLVRYNDGKSSSTQSDRATVEIESRISVVDRGHPNDVLINEILTEAMETMSVSSSSSTDSITVSVSSRGSTSAVRVVSHTMRQKPTRRRFRRQGDPKVYKQKVRIQQPGVYLQAPDQLAGCCTPGIDHHCSPTADGVPGCCTPNPQ